MGVAYPNIKEDILKIAVVERHQATGNIGIGFVQGFGLKKGAIGSSVAHDSHNLVIVGTNDRDILKTVEVDSSDGRRIGSCFRWKGVGLSSLAHCRSDVRGFGCPSQPSVRSPPSCCQEPSDANFQIPL